MSTDKAQSLSESPVQSRENVMAVYRRIRRMILSGHFKGGQMLSQVQLALDFETSRGPVREALRMLQREGLIEAETNQRGRIVTFSVGDLEQVCALLVLNVPMAVQMGSDRFTAGDIRTIQRAIGRIERLSADESGAQAGRDAERRQLAFRKLVTILCRYSGTHIADIIDGLLDRVAMFRQLHEIMGVSPPYPLANRFTELHEAAEERNANAMAAIMAGKIADLSRKAIHYVSKDHEPRILDAYSKGAQALIGSGSSGRDIQAEHEGSSDAITIKVRSDKGGRIACEIIQG